MAKTPAKPSRKRATKIATKPKKPASASIKRKAAPSRRVISQAAQRKHRAKRPPSSLERAIYAILEAEAIPFTKEKLISQCTVDIFIEPKTVVELQGCWWHRHDCLIPRSGWKPEDEQVRVKDAARLAFLASKGYKIVLIWECELAANCAGTAAFFRQLWSAQSALIS